MWSSLKNYSDGALLVTRVLLASIIFWVNGWPKLAGGITAWRRFAISEMGITLWPSFWGFLGVFAETLGCTLIILGLAFRPSILALLLTFALVALVDFDKGGLGRSAHALELMLFCVCLLFVGPGRFSMDKG